jgi:hypothetical protein
MMSQPPSHNLSYHSGHITSTAGFNKGIQLALESRFHRAIVVCRVIRLIIPLLHVPVVLLHILGKILSRVALSIYKMRLLSLDEGRLCFIGRDWAAGWVWLAGCGCGLLGVI